VTMQNFFDVIAGVMSFQSVSVKSS